MYILWLMIEQRSVINLDDFNSTFWGEQEGTEMESWLSILFPFEPQLIHVLVVRWAWQKHRKQIHPHVKTWTLSDISSHGTNGIISSSWFTRLNPSKQQNTFLCIPTPSFSPIWCSYSLCRICQFIKFPSFSIIFDPTCQHCTFVDPLRLHIIS